MLVPAKSGPLGGGPAALTRSGAEAKGEGAGTGMGGVVQYNDVTPQRGGKHSKRRRSGQPPLEDTFR